MFNDEMTDTIIAMTISLIVIIGIIALITGCIEIKKIEIENNYEIEKMKIEQGTNERKEVNINNERNEEPNKPITFLEL